LPSDNLWCRGEVASQTTYADLYAICGSAFNTGGEGAGNFRLPNRQDRVFVGKGATYFTTLGAAGGTMAVHSHTNSGTGTEGPTAITGTSGPGSAHNHSVGIASGAMLVAGGADTDVSTGNESAHTHGEGSYAMPAHAHTQGDTGTSSHLMAYQVLNYIIRYQ
jgi:microcystin-dependent protein